MLKKILLSCFLLYVAGYVFANNISTTIEINGVIINGGSVYVAVYSNENDYKNEICFYSFIMQPTNTTLIYNLELPTGEYVVSVFQDTNNNGELDTNFFGIPKEPVGITNYDGRGIPGGFQRLKVPINNTSAKLTVNIGRAG
jgi:uncharacterized protein (DUF2141 family)